MRVSIITVTYNSCKTLRNTIDSVLNQNYPDIEYIIIDGKSNDSTVNIIKSYQNIFKKRIKFISEPDNGIYDAMNKGIRMATGDIIGILNSDDFFSSPSIVSIISNSFSDETIDAIYGDVHFVKQTNLSKVARYYSSSFFSRRKMRLGLMPAHPSFYARKSVFERFGLYKVDYKIAADFEFLLRVIFNGRINTKYIPVDMVTMRTGGASTSGFSSHQLIMKEHLRAFRENDVYTNIFILSLRYFYKIYEVFKTKFMR